MLVYIGYYAIKSLSKTAQLYLSIKLDFRSAANGYFDYSAFGLSKSISNSGIDEK